MSCKNIFNNGTPSKWNIDIIEIGAKWWYIDSQGDPTGHADQDDKRVNLGSGESDELKSPSGECTAATLSIFKVEASDGRTDILSKRNVARPNECFTEVPLTLGPKEELVQLSNIDSSKSIQDILKGIEYDDLIDLGIKNDSLETSSNK